MKRYCSECQCEIPEHSPNHLCPKCLLKIAIDITETVDLEITDPQDSLNTFEEPYAPLKLKKGDHYGEYKIIKPLGKGGMGEVYEVIDQTSLRRLALKIFSHPIQSNEARNHFLQEGQLAANINHPNSVYIFGTEEINHRPVITMELVNGGNLKDLVSKDGPLNINKATDIILQAIEGLEAAHQQGILHRDIKPSNLFIDQDEQLKVGDYGLSISTLEYEKINPNEQSKFMGTPAFASPEQLKGEILDFRSDIYSLGATLYYLVSQKTLFKADDFSNLLSITLEQEPQFHLPIGHPQKASFIKVLEKCLEKSPNNRYKTLSEFRNALQPFATQKTRPAHYITKSFAFSLEQSLTAFPIFISYFWGVNVESIYAFLLTHLGIILYFGITEGIWGVSLFKYMMGMKVVDIDSKSPCGFKKASLRALIVSTIFYTPFYITTILNGGVIVTDPDSPINILNQVGSLLIIALMYIISRKNQHKQSLHDLLTNTEVILKNVVSERATITTLPSSNDKLLNKTIGPYHLFSHQQKEPKNSEHILLAYDQKLHRKIWIQQHLNAYDLPLARKDLARYTRLRWLTGQPTQQGWNAYEAPNGQPLTQLIKTPLKWEQFRFILFDIVDELEKSYRDNSFPNYVELNTIWVTENGRVKLLDFPAPNTSPHRHDLKLELNETTSHKEIVHFLHTVCHAALTGQTRSIKKIDQDTSLCPLPQHARNFLNNLSKTKSLTSIKTQLISLLKQNANIKPKQIYSLACVMMIPAAFFFIQNIITNLLSIAMQDNYDLDELNNLISELETGKMPDNFLSNLLGSLNFNEISFFDLVNTGSIEFTLNIYFMLLGLPTLLLNLFFNLDLPQHLMGFNFVTQTGKTIGRVRRLIRSLILWWPAGLLTANLFLFQFNIPTAVLNLTLSIFFVLQLHIVFSKKRHFHDWLTGAYPVPR